MERSTTPQEIFSSLIKSPHGDLHEYARAAEYAREEPAFLSHLIAWNEANGSIRDSKVALPVYALATLSDAELIENAQAALCLLDPRNFLRAVRLSREVKPAAFVGRKRRRLVERYLRWREANQALFHSGTLHHRTSLQELYALEHLARPTWVGKILFENKPAPGTPRDAVKRLASLPEAEAASLIKRFHIPEKIVRGAMAKRADTPDILLASVENMTAAEITTNIQALAKRGIKRDPALRAALEKGLERVSAASTSLKVSKAAAAVGDAQLAKKLHAAQERQMKSGSVEGNWLVLADCSASMHSAIEGAKHVAAALSRLVKGQVHLVYFNHMPRYFEVTGNTLAEIVQKTRHVSSGGMTSIGVGLAYALERRLDFDGIAILSDGGEGAHPYFTDVYTHAACEQPVYFYRFKGDPDYHSRRMAQRGVEQQIFNCEGMDYYALPNLAATMNTRRFTLMDQIFETPLLRLDGVFSTQPQEAYHATAATA